jgi:hypothetical protein
MFRTITKITALLIAIMSVTMLAHAQTTPTPAASDNYVTNSGFKNRVFEVQNRPPEDLVPVIRLLTSGFKGAQLSASNEFRTITVRDFPENIAAIDEAIKRMDKPETARPDIELRMHVLLASNQTTTLNQYPADLKDAIAELQKTLNYKEYYLMTSIVQRTRDSRGERAGYIQGKGSAEIGWPSATAPDKVVKRISLYMFDASSVTLTAGPSGAFEIQLGRFDFSLAVPGSEAKIHSDVRIREGEKVIVGTAGFNDTALILVMTARVIK